MPKNTAQLKTIFITGTDTGVGKTLLTGLLVHHLRSQGCRALAIKPFCSGGRGDVELLHALQDGELSEEEINPFYFREALAPLVAARRKGRGIPLPEVLKSIYAIASRIHERSEKNRNYLLIEGAGGVLTPLGETNLSRKGRKPHDCSTGSSVYTPASLMAELDCEAIIVAPNKLGTINCTMLTLRELQHIGIQNITVVLMDPEKSENSARTNPGILAELAGPIRVFSVPFFEGGALGIGTLKRNAKKIKKTLARILA